MSIRLAIYAQIEVRRRNAIKKFQLLSGGNQTNRDPDGPVSMVFCVRIFARIFHVLIVVQLLCKLLKIG
jgi:hypothetical protein